MVWRLNLTIFAPAFLALAMIGCQSEESAIPTVLQAVRDGRSVPLPKKAGESKTEEKKAVVQDQPPVPAAPKAFRDRARSAAASADRENVAGILRPISD
jgi:hypothetical protein